MKQDIKVFGKNYEIDNDEKLSTEEIVQYEKDGEEDALIEMNDCPGPVFSDCTKCDWDGKICWEKKKQFYANIPKDIIKFMIAKCTRLEMSIFLWVCSNVYTSGNNYAQISISCRKIAEAIGRGHRVSVSRALKKLAKLKLIFIHKQPVESTGPGKNDYKGGINLITVAHMKVYKDEKERYRKK